MHAPVVTAHYLHMLTCIHAGRELAKFMAAVQAAVYGSHEAVLTPEIFQSVLGRKMVEHEERKQFKLGHHGTGDSDKKEATAAAAVAVAAGRKKEA